MGGHESLYLLVLLLLEQLLYHLNVTVLGIPHQNQVSCQALLHSTLGVLADPLEVGTDLDRATTADSFSTITICRHILGKLKLENWKNKEIFMYTGMLITSSVIDIRLKAWMAASCTDKVVAGCLMHFCMVVLIAGSAASMASPMFPTTFIE